MKIWKIRRDVLSKCEEPEGGWKLVQSEDDVRQRSGALPLEFRSNRVALPDFVWPPIWQDLIAKEELAREITTSFKGARLLPTEITTKAGSKGSGGWQRDSYLVVWIEKFATLDRHRSSLVQELDEDGRLKTTVTGVEQRLNTDFHDPTMYDNVEWIDETFFDVKRTPGKGLFVQEDSLGGCDLFRIRELIGALFCTDRFVDFINEKRCSNIQFHQWGETV